MYDKLNRLTAMVDPEGGRTEYTYDAVGNLVSVKMPEGGVYGNAYDAADRKTSTTDALGHTESYT